MRKLLRAGVALAAAALAGGTLVAGVAGTAQASTIPPWETGSPPAVSPNEVGGLTFYNSSGQVITNGNISDDPIAAYVQGSVALQSSGTKAELTGFTPVINVAPGAWNGVPFFNSRYPNTSAPTALADSTLPLYSGVSGYSLSQLTEAYANSDTSSDGYAGLYVLRLQAYESPGGYSTTYDEADVSVNASTGAWSLVYSPQATTTTTLATPIPSSPQTVGAPVTLNATVADASAPGTVQFESNGDAVGSPVTVVDGAAQLVTTALPLGSDSLTAVFTPTTGAAFSGSTSTNPVSYTINAAAGCNPPTISSAPPTATATVGQAYDYEVTTCTTSAAPKIAATGLPKGLTLVNNGNGTATISGTPDVKDQPTYSGTITTTVKGQTPATQSFTITVDQAPLFHSTTKTLVDAGQAITSPFEVVTEYGNPTPALTATGLPSGVTLQDNGNGTGDFVGTPGATSGGIYSVTIDATNVVGTVQQTFTLTDYQAPTLSNVPSSETVTEGTAITPIVVNYAGYPAPKVKAAGLPKGLSASVDTTNDTVTISGTPTSKAVSETTTLTATSKAGSATGSIAFTVDQPAVFTSETSALVDAGQAITSPFEVVTKAGNPTPALTATGLPSGVTLQDNGNGTGDFVGTPGATSGGIYSVTIDATNVVGTVQQTFTLTDYQAPTLSNVPSSETVTEGTAITPIVVNYAGYPAPSVKVAGLPKGLSASVDTTNDTVTISGTPSTTAASGTATLTATSKAGTATGSIAFTVN